MPHPGVPRTHSNTNNGSSNAPPYGANSPLLENGSGGGSASGPPPSASGRRPSVYPLTDPNAASAACFSAEADHAMSASLMHRPSYQRGDSGAATARRDTRPSIDTGPTMVEPPQTGSPVLSVPSVASPFGLDGSRSSNAQEGVNASATSFFPPQNDGFPTAGGGLFNNAQSPDRGSPRRRSSSWLDRDVEPMGTQETIGPRFRNGDGERQNATETDSDADVCVAAPLVPAYGLDYDGIAEVLGSAAGIAPKKGAWPTSADSSSRVMFYSESTGDVCADSLETLKLPLGGDTLTELLQRQPFWIDVMDPSHSEMVTFSRLFGIHPLTTEDIQTEETREKCEPFMNYNFICIRTFDRNEDEGSYMQPVNVFIVVLRECVLSFHCKPIEHVRNVLKRIHQLKSYGLHESPDWVMYALLDDIVDGFMPLLKYVELEVDSIDDLVLILKESEQSDMLRRIGHARKKVMQLLRLISTKADVLKTVIKRCGERLPADSETSLYLGDIQDHAITMQQNLSHYEKTLARAHSNYLAQISIEITVASNRTNDVVMKMTAMASILLPLNVVTGLFGMNVTVPGRDDPTLVWFFSIITVMLMMACLVYWWARRHKLV
ncbi:CorA metal ion transporter [Geranomyces variabilis]|nr:CorA metal ion transporter [Geranomyces variabilis]